MSFSSNKHHPWRKQRIFLVITALLLLAIPIGDLLHLTLPSLAQNLLDAAQYVNPFIGTDVAPANLFLGSGYDSGNVFPGAVFPHGMLQWSPDTTSDPGGYHYADSTINGFSLTHFSGRGCKSYQDIPFMPTTQPVTTSPAGTSTYSSTFSHRHETASPGFYGVHLDNGVNVALTVTPRTGFGRFTYQRSQSATILINAGGSSSGNSDAGTGVEVIGNNQVVGSASSGHFCGKANAYTVYFAAIFDHPFASFGTWHGSSITHNSRRASGSSSGAFLTFDTHSNPLVQVKVGISFVSIANALNNLAHENPGWNFDAVHRNVLNAWNNALSAIRIDGGSPPQRQIFYTALYHTLIHPNIFSDANGQYLGFDHQVHLAQGYTQYENFPGWDMYRSLIGLIALIEPQQVSDMIQSLIADARQGGGGLPRWEVANDNSGGMIGDPQDVVIAMSYAFGARRFDTQGAFTAMDAGASILGTRSGRYEVREGLSEYLTHGYVSATTDSSAAITLEYAIDDFAIAQFARALGKTSAYQKYLQRSHNWQRLFHNGYIQPRNPDGSFSSNFDPSSENGFAEGNSAQYSWLVPQDLPALFHAMGGNGKVISRLDDFFNQLNAGPDNPHAFMGNEPCFEVPWEYDAAGAPYRTQQVVRHIETALFAANPGGLPGNDDAGAISSWYIFGALGLYPEVPGVAGFAVGSPLFPSITIRLGNGHELHIMARGGSNRIDNEPYVQSLSLNGQNYNSAWIPFAALANGATLQFSVGSNPNKEWGRAPTLSS